MKLLIQLRTCCLPIGLVCLLVCNAPQPAVAKQTNYVQAVNRVLVARVERGIASRYARRFEGSRTASGELYKGRALTAAHKSLPFGTRVRVRSLRNGKAVVVRINDRGPFVAGRIIDLSQAAAQALGVRGLTRVAIERLP